MKHLVSLVFATVACAPELPPAPAEGAPLPEVAAAPLPPDLPEVEPVFGYSAIAKRDPFTPLTALPDVDRPRRTELERYSLDQLQLAGVVQSGARAHALVVDPKGKGHTLVRGTLIGPNFGRVASITGECVTIRHELYDVTGRKVRSDVEKCMPALEIEIN